MTFDSYHKEFEGESPIASPPQRYGEDLGGVIERKDEKDRFFEEKYELLIAELFQRFPSFQNVGAGAYKPGIDNIMMFDSLLGHPHVKYPTIHIAGTNGKGSVSSMLSSVCAASGMKVGLYTSPHILDFRERMRIIDGRRNVSENETETGSGNNAGGNCGSNVEYIPKQAVWDFVQQWRETMDHLDLSFFEITTMVALQWFATQEVDIAVIETGLGGRLDSTNIITPVLSVITNIGFDHCDMLGGTLPEIAFEKAGIIKPVVRAVVGESDPQTDEIFRRKMLYTNIDDPKYYGNRDEIMSLLTFADKTQPRLWDRRDEILRDMDLQGEYQLRNLRTTLACIDVLRTVNRQIAECPDEQIVDAIEHTALTTDFHGRWEKLCDTPYIIADIGHNSHGLKYNFAQLGEMMATGKFSRLCIIYATIRDKDVDKIMELMPHDAQIFFVTPSNKRAMPAEEIMSHYVKAGGNPANARCETLSGALFAISSMDDALVFIGGSAYLVSEAVPLVKNYK